MRPGRLELMIRHIGFAERWLARARAECTRGHVVRGALTLLLAEAEVHHAREVFGPNATTADRVVRTPRSNRALVAVAALIIGIAAALLASGPGSVPLVVQDDALSPAPIVVRLTHEVGSVLALVPSTSAVTRDIGRTVDAGPVRSTTGRIASPSSAHQKADIKADLPIPAKRVLSAGPEPIVRRGAVKSTPRARVARLDQKRRLRIVPVASTGLTAASEAEPGVISDADLIDLVLAAERSLRTGSR